MTSNGDPVLIASAAPSLPAATIDPRARSTASASPAASKAPSPESNEHQPAQSNGNHHVDSPENESEAETVLLDADDDEHAAKQAIKRELSDDADGAPRPRSFKDESRVSSPQLNGRRRFSNGVKTNGTKHMSQREGKSPIPTSPSSRTTSRHTNDTSPTESALSPTQSTTRGCSASAVENRKRKPRKDSFPNSQQPPRQKAKTEGPQDAQPQHFSPTAFIERPHRRSHSSHIVPSSINAEKRRKVKRNIPATLSIEEQSHWLDPTDSSENSYSPPANTPNRLQHTRLKRSSHRAPTSPARTMVKPKTDRFGATRLARESEKGDLDAVKEAYEEARDELNQVDYAGIAPLQKAALHGWADVVRYLIKQGCNTACESYDRDTPLIDAVENSHLDVVKILLSEGHVNPHHSNKKGQRAIDVLDPEDDDAEEIEKTLREAMKKESNTSNVDKQPERKQAKTASRLLHNEFNVETLIEKAADGDIIAVGELISSNIKPNITCGVAAARGGHYDILSILLASGLKADPDPSKHPDTPMTVAIGRGHLKIIELLLEQDNFDPTRRNKENKTYYELAEEKAGPKWELERDLLKRAYDAHKGQHRSPRRARKEPPHPLTMRAENSQPKRDRTSSPRQEGKRVHLAKSASSLQKPRRLMSGKEMASREGKRRKRVVDDESSEGEGSEEDVRAPTRKTRPRSYSLGEENKPAKQPLNARSDDNGTAKRKARAQSDDSEDDRGSKPPPKIRKGIEKPSSAKPTPESDLPNERKVVKNKIKYKPMEDKIKKRKLSDASVDNLSVKKTPTASAKSTPAPPERVATPEAEREKRQEEQRLEIEARRKAAEAAAEAENRRREEEENARKAAEEAARKAAEEAEAKRKAEAEAEAQRQADEAEAARKREEEEAQRRAEEEARRQALLLARQDRISRLPCALRRACERGQDRPLHFAGEELGISILFLPLIYATSQDLDEDASAPPKTYVCSYQLVGILGLPELDLAHLDAPYVDWPRVPVTSQQRDAFLRLYDWAMLAQDFRFPREGDPDFNYSKMIESIKKAKNQFLAMDGLYWVEESFLHAEVESRENLQPLLNDIKSERFRKRINLGAHKPKPRKSFMETLLEKTGVGSGMAAVVDS